MRLYQHIRSDGGWDYVICFLPNRAYVPRPNFLKDKFKLWRYGGWKEDAIEELGAEGWLPFIAGDIDESLSWGIFRRERDVQREFHIGSENPRSLSNWGDPLPPFRPRRTPPPPITRDDGADAGPIIDPSRRFPRRLFVALRKWFGRNQPPPEA